MRYLSIILALVTIAPVFGQNRALSPFDSTEVISFLDGTIETHMKDKHIAGATMALVKDGEIKILKGYGYKDIENRIPVDPANTLFRIGSISKTFVWTSIMQLVEQGKISLDDNINDYFDSFQIPDTYPEPITIKDLMTHTPGFEDLVIQLFVKDTAYLKPLAEVLKDQIPARVRPPGKFASYSNHGTGMAALIVEKVSGMKFSDYVAQNITGPLKMNNTLFDQPLPVSLQDQMSTGYTFEGGEFVAQDFELIPLAPVGAVSATAADMARFMMMHLQLGQLDGSVILDSATARLMQSPAHRHHPDVNPMRYGLMDVSQNGEAIIGHGGDTFWFHSLMALFPEHNLGLFISFNSQAGGGAYMDVLEDFCDRYFPENVQDLLPQSPEFLEPFTGTYESNRYPHSDLFKISKLMSVIKITASEDGGLKTSSGGDIDYWYHLHDNTFRNKDNSNVIVFEMNDEGEPEHIFLGLLPIIVFDRVDGADTPDAQIMIAVISGIIIILTFIYWTLIFFIKKRLDVLSEPKNTLPGFARTVGWFTSLLILLFYIGIAMIFSNPFEVVYGIPGSLKFLLIIPFIVILFALVMTLQVWVIWNEREARIFSRIWYTLVWVSALATIWQWNYWNFLGWKY